MMEDSGQSKLLSSISANQNDELPIFNVHSEPVMIEAINVISLLGKSNKVIIRAKGDSIPNAVAIANIITEKMLKGNSKIQKFWWILKCLQALEKCFQLLRLFYKKISNLIDATRSFKKHSFAFFAYSLINI